MQLKTVFAAIGLALTAGLYAPAPADAGWFWRDKDPDAPDRYPYVYEPPRYYPYYNSGDWRPAAEMRRPRPYYVQPPYYPAWGYPIGLRIGMRAGPAEVAGHDLSTPNVSAAKRSARLARRPARYQKILALSNANMMPPANRIGASAYCQACAA